MSELSGGQIWALLALARRAGLKNPSYEFRDGLHIITHWRDMNVMGTGARGIPSQCQMAFTFARTMTSTLMDKAIERGGGK